MEKQSPPGRTGRVRQIELRGKEGRTSNEGNYRILKNGQQKKKFAGRPVNVTAHKGDFRSFKGPGGKKKKILENRADSWGLESTNELWGHRWGGALGGKKVKRTKKKKSCPGGKGPGVKNHCWNATKLRKCKRPSLNFEKV